MSGVQANLLLAGVQNASPWPTMDELQAPQKLAMAQQRNALLNRMDEQTLQNNQIEYAARASAGLLSLNDEAAMAKAYPDVVAEGRKYGYLMNAPADFPGVERLKQIAAMGTPSKDLLSNAATARAKQTLAPSDGSSATTPTAAPVTTGAVPAAPLTIEADAQARAAAVRDGLIKRGLDADTATAFAANALHESSARPDTGPGDRGSSHGLFQWRDDRFTRYQKIMGNLPDNAPLDQQLDYVVNELNTTEGAARDRIAAAQGPAAKAAAISQYYLRPKDVQAEMARRSATATQLQTQLGGAPAGGQRVQVASITPTTATDATPAPVTTSATPPAATPLPQAEAVATAARTGQSVPIQNGNGLMAHPDGNIGPPRAAVTLPASTQPPAQSQAPSQQDLPPLPPLQTPPRLEANGYTTSQNRAIKAAQEDPKVSTEEFQTMLKGFSSQNQSATDKALEHNLSIQRELRERLQNAQQQQRQQQDYALRLQQAERQAEELRISQGNAQRAAETHEIDLKTKGVPPGYQRNLTTNTIEPQPGYQGALREGYEWDPEHPGQQRIILGGPADPKVIAAQDAARRTGGRVMGETERTKLIEQAGLVDSTGRLSSTFKPEFGGFFSGTYGDFRNWLAAQTPGESPRADWWKEYQRTNVLGQRHAIAGASMTPTEQAEYAKADISPGMSPETIIQNLAVQQRILETARNRRVKAMAAEGYNKDAIAAASGVDPDEVTAPTSQQQTSQPLNVRPGATRPPLSSFAR